MDRWSTFQLIKGFRLYNKGMIANHDIKWCFLKFDNHTVILGPLGERAQ